MIANLTLDGLERLLRVHYPPNTKRAQRAKVNLVKYCDDFIITGSSQAVLEQEVQPLVEHFLHERGLEVALPLTVVTNSIARSNVGTLETDAHAAWVESIAVAARETTTALGLSSNAQ